MTTLFPTVNVELDEGAYLPERAHDTDAGADIRTPEAFTLPARGYYIVHTGVHIELTENSVGMIKSKSGLYLYHGISSTGVIDEGFSGEIVVRLTNHSDEPYRFEKGDKFTQLVIQQVCYPTYKLVDKVGGGERGDAGWGSTGR